MKRIIAFSLFSAMLIIACSPRNVKEIGETSEAVGEKAVKQAIVLKPVDGYFTTLRPNATTTLVLDKVAFEENFKPAATMNNLPTIINFDTDRAIAIVLPETRREVGIIIDSSYMEANVLHISYTIDKGKEERSFSMIPCKVYSFDANLGINAVNFNNGESFVEIK